MRSALAHHLLPDRLRISGSMLPWKWRSLFSRLLFFEIRPVLLVVERTKQVFPWGYILDNRSDFFALYSCSFIKPFSYKDLTCCSFCSICSGLSESEDVAAPPWGAAAVPWGIWFISTPIARPCCAPCWAELPSLPIAVAI